MQVALSLLLTSAIFAFSDGFGKPQFQTENINSCEVAKFAGIIYKKGNLLGPNVHQVSGTFEHCIARCQAKIGCIAVNYKPVLKFCSLLSEGIQNAESADPKNYAYLRDTIHGVLKCSTQIAAMASQSVGCGRQAPGFEPYLQNPHHRIIGGTEAKPHSWPWLATLFIQIDDSWGICGASLLRVNDGAEESDILLTAAHCVTKPETQATNPESVDASKVKTMLGNHNREINETGEQFPDVKEVRHHPQFKFKAEDGANNDIALLKLSTPVKFSDTIRPICLPTASEDLPIGKLCVAAGWGRNASDSTYKPPALQQLVVPVHDANTCKGGWFCWSCWGSTYHEAEMICGGDLEGTSAPCKGDSGGQLACQQPDGSWTLYGATSFAVNSCLNPSKPPIFSRVSSYIDWITKNVGEMTSL